MANRFADLFGQPAPRNRFADLFQRPSPVSTFGLRQDAEERRRRRYESMGALPASQVETEMSPLERGMLGASDWLQERRRVYEESKPEGFEDPYEKLGSTLTRNVAKGAAGVVSGVAGTAEMGLRTPAVHPGIHPKIKDLLARGAGKVAGGAERIREELTAPEERGDIFSRIAEDPINQVPAFLAEQLPQFAGAAGAASKIAVLGKGATALPSFVLEAGTLYRDLLKEGIDEGMARKLSTGAGAAIAFLDRLPIDHFLKGSPKNVLVKAFQQMFLEGGTEAMQEVPAILSEVAGGVDSGRFGSWEEGLEDRFTWRRIAAAGVGGGLVGGVVGPFGGRGPSPAPQAGVVAPEAAPTAPIRFPNVEESVNATLAARGIDAQARAEMVKEGVLAHKDPVTGFHSRTLLVPTIRRALKHQQQTGQDAFYVEADLVNLGGLNGIMGKSQVDERVFRPFFHTMKKELDGTGASVSAFNNGGDERGFVVVGAPAAEIAAALSRAESRDAEMATELDLDRVPHKTRPGMFGTGVKWGLARIEPDIRETMQRADVSVELKKKGWVLPDWHGEQGPIEAAGPLGPLGREAPGRAAGPSQAGRGARAPLRREAQGREAPTPDELGRRSELGIEESPAETPPPPPPPPGGRPPGEVFESYDRNFAPDEDSRLPRFGDWAKMVYQRLFNRGQPVEFNRDVTYALDQARGARTIATWPVEHGVYRLREDADGYEKVAPSLKEILKGVDLDHFRRFVVAQQDLELDQQGKPGTKPAESAEVLQALRQELGPDGYAKLEQTATEWRDWLDAAYLDVLVDVGVITPEDKARMKGKNQFFAPMVKLMDALEQEGGNLDDLDPTRVQMVKKLGLGSRPRRRTTSFGRDGDQRIKDPVSVSLERVLSAGIFAEKQRLYQALVRNLEDNPEAAQALGIERAEAKPAPVAVVDGEVVYRKSKDQPANSFAVYENGQKVYYTAPKNILAALDVFSPKEVGLAGWLANRVTRMKRAGAVLAPGFQSRNIGRDQVEAFVYSPTLGKASYKPVISVLKAVGEYAGKGELFHEFFLSGSGDATLVSPDKESLQRYLRHVSGSNSIANEILRYGNPVGYLRMTSDALETATRMGVYIEARQGGLSIAEARHAAREATVDFRRLGIDSETYNRYVSFFGASMAGFDKLVRFHIADGIKGMKGDAAAAKRWRDASIKAVVGITVPSIALWLAHHDDEDYQELRGWEKDVFWHVTKVKSDLLGKIPRLGLMFRRVPGKTDEYWLRFPKPPGSGWLFGSLPERMLNYTYDYHPGAIVEMLKSFERHVAPPGIPLTPGSLTEAPVEALPDILAPVVENVSNYSFFFDRPIVPPGTEALPELQINDRTSRTVQRAAELIAQIPGAPDMLKSPAQLENLIYGWTATLGRATLNAADALVADQRPGLPVDPTKVFPFSTFLRREPTGTRTDSATRFYEESTKVDQIDSRIRLYSDQGRQDEAYELAQAHPEYQVAKAVRKIRREMSNLQKAKIVIREKEDWTPEEKQRKIDQIDAHLLALSQIGLQWIEPFRRNTNG